MASRELFLEGLVRFSKPTQQLILLPRQNKLLSRQSVQRGTLAFQDLEFHGVMRFYFQDADQKVVTKCIRVSSTASVHDVVCTLIEKFRPDIRMLSIPDYTDYALYEIHENGGRCCSEAGRQARHFFWRPFCCPACGKLPWSVRERQ